MLLVMKGVTNPTRLRNVRPITIQDLGNTVVVTFQCGATDAEYRAHLDEMTRLLESKRQKVGLRWAVVIDATRWIKSTAAQRSMHAEWMRQHQETIREREAGIAFVINSPLVRGGLTAVLWLSPLPCPHKVVAELPQAFAWVEQQLGEPIGQPHSRTA